MPLAALREILSAAGIDAPEMPKIAGADPVLPTPYRVGTAGAASPAALGVAVSRLGELRGLRPQKVAVDLRAATLSLRPGIAFKAIPPEVQQGELEALMGAPAWPARADR